MSSSSYNDTPKQPATIFTTVHEEDTLAEPRIKENLNGKLNTEVMDQSPNQLFPIARPSNLYERGFGLIAVDHDWEERDMKLTAMQFEEVRIEGLRVWKTKVESTIQRLMISSQRGWAILSVPNKWTNPAIETTMDEKNLLNLTDWKSLVRVPF